MIINHTVFVPRSICRTHNYCFEKQSRIFLYTYYPPAYYVFTLWECVGSFMPLCIQGVFCVWPCPPLFCLWRSSSIWYEDLYSFITAKLFMTLCVTEFRLWIVDVGTNMFCPAAKSSLLTDISKTSIARQQCHSFMECVCVFLSGISESTAEGLHKTHQEPTQTGPQLQLQTHPSRFQERWQWQVGGLVRCEDAGVCLWILDLSICLFYSGVSLCLIAGYSGHRWHFCLVLSVNFWKPVNPESPICHFEYIPLFLTVMHDDARPLLSCAIASLVFIRALAFSSCLRKRLYVRWNVCVYYYFVYRTFLDDKTRSSSILRTYCDMFWSATM